MTKSITPSTPDWYASVRDVIVAGLSRACDDLQAVAIAYVAAIDKDPAFREYLADELPNTAVGLLRNLERVGRGQLDSRIAAGGIPYGNKLARLPMSEQRQAIDGQLMLLTSAGDTLQVSVNTIMPAQAKQLFDVDHIRSLAEQRAWMEAKLVEATVNTKRATRGPIEIDRKHKCIVVNGVRISAEDLASYLAKLTAK